MNDVIINTDDNYLSERFFSGLQVDDNHLAVNYFNGNVYVLRFNFVDENSEGHSELERRIKEGKEEPR